MVLHNFCKSEWCKNACHFLAGVCWCGSFMHCQSSALAAANEITSRHMQYYQFSSFVVNCTDAADIIASALCSNIVSRPGVAPQFV